ncbi:MAG: MoaD/ThiS family protein [Nitrospinaceae bacterium]|jgi:hypothetical protein|nr:MoaD/ThiS family protein [Nitrospinaceae bacterium]MBT3434869.1 MoaD/ThiS family protein [Nitrospinaceae bacterium]MBT4092929.1 MoaD/ThiS family protein [Nitrospinaceae bacterium]MBT4432395.1 MoaD/ThiS family protein [Nitrospinaceae bacterium]MBT5370032.1 MoaD/ThiS family protein [Nitrospinaceae bacterium]
MNIRLRLYADFEDKMPAELEEDGSAGLEVPPNALVKDVLDTYGIPYEEAYVILLDGRHAPKETPLIDGCELCIFPAIVGG